LNFGTRRADKTLLGDLRAQYVNQHRRASIFRSGGVVRYGRQLRRLALHNRFQFGARVPVPEGLGAPSGGVVSKIPPLGGLLCDGIGGFGFGGTL
jgi:hypothetical protein